MTTAVLERVTLRFTLLDTNGNGYVEAGDFERLARRIIESVAEPMGSAKALAVLEGHRRYWRSLADGPGADHGADGPGADHGGVSLGEYVTRVAGPERFDDALREYAESLASLADVNDDGFIEHAHFVACMLAIGFHPDKIDAVFRDLDPHGMGKVATGAWITSIKDFYVSERTDIPAQHLLATPGLS
ncbi:calcium-binding protein [Streptosporangium sp. NPDC051022]|uniref:EF-hand domain-containing protein n=1 Tax=Streptosporangium sp. NPDC051022 TaxID=3155752 RepID=UPI003436C3A7